MGKGMRGNEKKKHFTSQSGIFSFIRKELTFFGEFLFVDCLFFVCECVCGYRKNIYNLRLELA